MNATAALAALTALRGLGYAVSADGGRVRLRFRGDGEPPAVLVVPLLAAVREHRLEALRLLAAEPQAGVPSCSRDHCNAATLPPSESRPPDREAAEKSVAGSVAGGASVAVVAECSATAPGGRGQDALRRGADSVAPVLVPATLSATHVEPPALSGGGTVEATALQHCSVAVPSRATAREHCALCGAALPPPAPLRAGPRQALADGTVLCRTCWRRQMGLDAAPPPRPAVGRHENGAAVGVTC